MDKLKLMRLAETSDEDAYEQQDFSESRKMTEREAYEAFYDDVKQPSKYIREDW
ncbi:MAG: hypothetical protein IJF71_04425 [Clostridia bacterium]|nr:hypothetical protein [Clostridia bacterium]